MRNKNGASLFLETLLDEGITHLFGNPGTTELPLMDALVNEERLKFILTLHEGVAISAAEGYGLSTGKPAAINLHVAPGLGNAMGLLYNAKRSGAPMLVTAGNQPQSGHFQEIILYDDLARMAEPLVKWSYEVRRGRGPRTSRAARRQGEPNAAYWARLPLSPRRRHVGARLGLTGKAHAHPFALFRIDRIHRNGGRSNRESRAARGRLGRRRLKIGRAE